MLHQNLHPNANQYQTAQQFHAFTQVGTGFFAKQYAEHGKDVSYGANDDYRQQYGHPERGVGCFEQGKTYAYNQGINAGGQRKGKQHPGV